MFKLKTIIITILATMIFSKISSAGNHQMTMMYGGEFTNMNIVANGDHMSV